MKKFALIFAVVVMTLFSSCVKCDTGETAPKYYTVKNGPFTVYCFPGINTEDTSGKVNVRIPDLYVIKDDSGEVFGAAYNYTIGGKVPQTRAASVAVVGKDGDPLDVGVRSSVREASIDVLCEELMKRLDGVSSAKDLSDLERYKAMYKLFVKTQEISGKAYTLSKEYNDKVVGEE